MEVWQQAALHATRVPRASTRSPPGCGSIPWRQAQGRTTHRGAPACHPWVEASIGYADHSRRNTVSLLVRAVLYTLIPVAAATLAGVVATVWPPREGLTSAVQHFAAGVVFAAAAIELLPELLRHSPVATI